MQAVQKTPWSQISSRAICKLKRSQCVKCQYSSGMGVDKHNVSNMTCDYLLIVGHSRGCSPINCAKFEPRTRRKRRQPLRINFKGSGEVYDEEKAESVQGVKERDKDTG